MIDVFRRIEKRANPGVGEFAARLEAPRDLRALILREKRNAFTTSLFQYPHKSLQRGGSEKSHVLSIPDAENPQSGIAVTGTGTQRARLDGALWYYLEALLARMRSHIRERFKPVAAIVRKSSSADLLSSNLLFREALHSAPRYITTDRIGSRVRALCEFWGRPLDGVLRRTFPSLVRGRVGADCVRGGTRGTSATVNSGK